MSSTKYTPEEEQQIVSRFKNGESYPSMLRDFGGSDGAIRNVLKRHGVFAYRYKNRSQAQIDEIIDLWHQQCSLTEISRRTGINYMAVGQELRRHGIEIERRWSKAFGPDHGAWKGGRCVHNEYILVWVHPSDPFRSMAYKTGYAPEHRLVMARHLNRSLTSNESVHHINGDKTDNRIENLQLRQNNHGKGVTMVCHDCGSFNVGNASLD